MDEESAPPSETVPPPPTAFGSGLPPHVRDALHGLLLHGHGDLSDVYRAMLVKPHAGPTELRELTSCANPGVVGNRRVVVHAVFDGTKPTAASRARQAASSVRSLLKLASGDTKAHLAEVLTMLVGVSSSTEAIEQETTDLESDSAELADTLKAATGVYVYTFPHYWRYPHTPGGSRTFLKIGRTTGGAWNRVLAQARQTGMPEDPHLLRVYTAVDPTAAESTFHMLLDAAEHHRSEGVAVGTEWFVTTLEYCDAIATALGLGIVRGSSDVS